MRHRTSGAAPTEDRIGAVDGTSTITARRAHPVLFDPSGRRRRAIQSAALVTGLALTAFVSVFAMASFDPVAPSPSYLEHVIPGAGSDDG